MKEPYFLKTEITLTDRIEQIIKDIREDVRTGFKEYNGAIRDLTKKRDKVKIEKVRLLDAVKAGINPAVMADELNNLKKID